MSVATTGSDASATTLFGIVRGRGGKAHWSQPFVFAAAIARSARRVMS